MTRKPLFLVVALSLTFAWLAGCGGELAEDVGMLSLAAKKPKKKIPTPFVLPIDVFKEGMYCDPSNQSCPPADLAQLFYRCEKTSRCSSENICVSMDQGALHGYCLEKCDPNAPSCSGGAECEQLSSGTSGACMPVGTASEDAVCGGQDPNADKMDMSKLCKSGMSCIVYRDWASEGVCVPRVDPDSCPKTCVAGRVCVPLLGGEAVCVFPCGPKLKCPFGLKCIEVIGGKVCLAP